MKTSLLPPKISVIVCTHNPRTDYLSRVLTSLRTQTLPLDQWEMLIIDNASTSPIASDFDIAWHPYGRHIREDELGLTPARLRGISEARGELLVFVDDDNVLDETYLKLAIEIGETHPWLGSWGGTIRPEFETPPPEWTRPMWGRLAIRLIEQDAWSNDFGAWKTQPCGAGMCVRRFIALKWHADLLHDPSRRQLGRRGQSLMSTEDIDLIVTAHDFSLGWGNFSRLGMTHLLPSSRFTRRYLIRLIEGMMASEIIFLTRRGRTVSEPSNVMKVFLRYAYYFIRHGRFQADSYRATQRGMRIGWQIITNQQSSKDQNVLSHIK